MIASDIHGSAFYCEKLLEAYDREQADKLLLLGDILYHGPRNDLPKEYAPKKVIAMLNERKQDILCVRGNCDTEVDQMVLEFSIMTEYAILYVGNHMIFITHGHNLDTKSLTGLKQGDILLHGHTHIPAWEEKEFYLYLNPGSVSIPKEGSQNSYMILEEETFYWKNLDGEIYHKKRI